MTTHGVSRAAWASAWRASRLEPRFARKRYADSPGRCSRHFPPPPPPPGMARARACLLTRATPERYKEGRHTVDDIPF